MILFQQDIDKKQAEETPLEVGSFPFVELFKHKMGSHLFGDLCIEKEIKQMFSKVHSNLFLLLFNCISVWKNNHNKRCKHFNSTSLSIAFCLHCTEMKIVKVGRNLFPQSSQSSNLHDTDQITTLIQDQMIILDTCILNWSWKFPKHGSP